MCVNQIIYKLTLKLSIKTMKFRNKTLGLTKIENHNQNLGWIVLKKNNERNLIFFFNL